MTKPHIFISLLAILLLPASVVQAQQRHTLDANGWSNWLSPDGVTAQVRDLGTQKLAASIQAQTIGDQPRFRIQWVQLDGTSFSLRVSGSQKIVDSQKQAHAAAGWQSVKELKIYDSGGFYWIALWHKPATTAAAAGSSTELDSDGWTAWLTPAQVSPNVEALKKSMRVYDIKGRTDSGQTRFKLQWLPSDGVGFSLRMTSNPAQAAKIKGEYSGSAWKSVREIPAAEPGAHWMQLWVTAF